MLWILFQAILYQTAFYQTFTTWTKWPQKLPNKLFLLVPVSIWPGAFAILATKVPAISWYQWFQAMVDFQLIKMSCGLPGREGFKAVTLSIISVNSWKTEISPATKFLSIVLRFSVLSSSSLLCSAEDCRGRDCHPTGHSLFRTCKVPKLFHQANTTHTTLSSKLLSVTAKRMYAFWTINTMPPCPHAPMPSILILNMSNQQANGNISNRHCCAQTAKGNIVILLDTLCFEHAKYLSPFIKRTQPIPLSRQSYSQSQPSECMHSGQSIPDGHAPMPSILILNMSNQQANGNISNRHCCAQTAKGNIVILLDTLCFEHAKYLSPFIKRTQPIPLSRQSYSQSQPSECMHSGQSIPCRHAPMPSILILNMSNQQANGNISNRHCCAQTAKGNIVILLDTLCFEHAKYIYKSFHQANTTHTTFSSKLLSVTAKRMYAFWTINTGRPYPHAINSDSQHVQSASERKHLQSSLLCSDSQGKHCHPTGHSLFQTCKVPKSFHQVNTTHTTLSSKLLSVTAKRMYAFWTTINTMPPCPHAINSDSQHVQSASERKHLQSSLLCSDSQGKHCHPTGHSLFRTCKVPKSFHQANTTHTTLSSNYSQSQPSECMHSGQSIPDGHAPMPSILILNMSNQQANGNISNRHCCAQTAKGNIVILLDTLCFEHAKYLSPFIKRRQPIPLYRQSYSQSQPSECMPSGQSIPCRHAPMPSILILNISNQQANGNISNRHCCAQTAKGNIVILLDTFCFEHAKYLSPFIKRTQPIPLSRQSYSQSQPSECMHSGRQSIPCRHAPMPSILILNMSNQQANGNISNRHCCAQTAKGNIVILLDTLCFEHAKYIYKSFHQANTTHTTFSSKLLSVTAKRMYAFWTINTMPPCPDAINSDSQHVQSASERKHLQSSLLCSDSQGKHCHPTGHSLFRTCKVHI